MARPKMNTICLCLGGSGSSEGSPLRLSSLKSWWRHRRFHLNERPRRTLVASETVPQLHAAATGVALCRIQS